MAQADEGWTLTAVLRHSIQAGDTRLQSSLTALVQVGQYCYWYARHEVSTVVAVIQHYDSTVGCVLCCVEGELTLPMPCWAS